MENKKENYFEILGLKQEFKLEPDKLEIKYLEMQKELREHGKDNDKIALINKAYSSLKEPVNRARHLLELVGFGNFTSTLPSEFLYKIMDLEEKLEEGDSKSIATIEGMYQTYLQSLETAFENEEYDVAASHYAALKYITTLRKRIHANYDN